MENNNLDSKQLADFYSRLDDKNLQAFYERGPAGLDDESLQHLHVLLNGYPQETPQQPQREQIAGMPVYDTGIPGIGKVADWTVPVASWLKENAAQPVEKFAEQTRQAYPGTTGKVLGGVTDLGASLIPQTPGQVKLNIALPIAAKAAGVAGKAAMSIPPVNEAISGVVGALSKIPAPLVKKVLQTPEILNRYVPLEKAGEVMSDFFNQLGLKSGSEAMAGAAEGMGKAAPTLNNFAPIADKTVEAIKNMPAIKQEMASIEQQAAQMASQGINDANHAQIWDLKNKYEALQKQLPNAQDALVARQYLSRITSKQALSSTGDQVVSAVANKNKALVDDYLDSEVERLTTEAFKAGKELKPIEVPGYGKITTPAQVRQIYHEAKIGDAFSSFFPENKLGQVDSLRLFTGALLGKPGIALQSPQLYKRALQAGTAIANPTTASNIAETGTSLSNLFNKKEGQ